MLIIQSKKTDYNTKTHEIENKTTTDHDHDKCIITQDLNKLTSENFTTGLKQTNLPSKNDIAKFVKYTNFDDKLNNVSSNKNELNELSKQLKQYRRKY